MAHPETRARLEQGVESWNQWRSSDPLFHPDLSGASLAGMKLSGVDFTGALLIDANLANTDLGGAGLAWADLSRSHLGQANLIGTNLSGTNLSEAHLEEAVLTAARFQTTILTGANLLGAWLGLATFANVDLSETQGLDAIRHTGPCTMGIDTIVRSGGKIPEVFLRGCGVPEQFITYARSLVGKPVEFYSCFISYSSNDQAFTERLHADLVSKNLRCWFAPEDLKIGDLFQERIEESIRFFDKVMIVLSEASVQSVWVEREVNAGREREDREKRTVLFPIRIDDAVMKAPQAWAADIRRARHIGDFRGWETPLSYTKALDRLLRDLRAQAPAAAPNLDYDGPV